MYFKLFLVISLCAVLIQADERSCRRVQIKNNKMHGECCVFVREENENVREEIEKLLEDIKPKPETIRPVGAPPPPPPDAHHQSSNKESPNTAKPLTAANQQSQYLPPRLGTSQPDHEKPPLERKKESEKIPVSNGVTGHPILLEPQATKHPVNGGIINQCNCENNPETSKNSHDADNGDKLVKVKSAVTEKSDGSFSDSFVFPSEENATSTESSVKNLTSTNTTGKFLFDNRNAVDAPAVNCPSGQGRDPSGNCAGGF